MKRIPFILSLFVGLLMLFLNIYGVRLLNKMPWLPDDAQALVVKALKGEDGAVMLEGIELENKDELEFILCRRISGKNSGDRIELSWIQDGRSRSQSFQLVSKFARNPFPEIYLVIGFLSMAIGILIFVRRNEELRGRLLYWLIMIFSTAVILVAGYHCLDQHNLSFLPAGALYMCYALLPAVVLHFALAFLPQSHPSRKITFAIYLPALVFIGLLEFLFLNSIILESIQAYRRYHDVFLFFRLYVLLYILGAALVFIWNYRRAALQEYRLQIKWILLGLILGGGPFVLFYNLPKMLALDEIISMEVSMTFCLVVPVAMAIAVFRHRLLDIELVLNRSLVYSILTVFIVALYIFLIRVLQNLFSQVFEIQDTVVSALAAGGAALAFHPARRRIQEFVDRSFFRSNYDYQRCIQKFSQHVHLFSSRPRLMEYFNEQIKSILPMDHLGIVVFSQKADQNFPLTLIEDGQRPLELAPHIGNRQQVLARHQAVFTEEDIDFSLDQILTDRGLDLVIPMSFSVIWLWGYVTFAKKKSGEKFTREDMSLLTTLTARLAMNLEKIQLQEEVVFERAEKEKLDEVNRLKTEFISSVSHELRTPLSTLRSLSELLHEGKIKDKQKQEKMLGMMSDECTRLSQFLHNILDRGKIEQDSMSYHREVTDLNALVQETLLFFEHRFQNEGFELLLHLPEGAVPTLLDPDAIKQALTNLIDNAIKYSTRNKKLKVELRTPADRAELSIRDSGAGIPIDEQARIFSGFYRGRQAQHLNPGGVGIGLKIVKHIMEAHGGEIRLESCEGQGTTFTLIFKVKQL